MDSETKQEIERLMVPTEKGLIKQDVVEAHKVSHLEQVKEQSGLLADPD